MKRILVLVSIVIMLSGILLFTLPAADNGGPDTSMPGDGGDGGSGGGTLWWKNSKECPNDDKKTEYSCTSGGLDQCTVQNCP